MKTKYLQEILQSRTISIPLYLYREKEKFQLDEEEFIFLMYLVERGEKFLFDPVSIQKDLGKNLEEVMEKIESLSDKKFLQVEVIKNSQGVREEWISLESFWNQVLQDVIGHINEEEDTEDTTIYDMIQKEFGRTLSSIEYEIIGAWVESNISEELIHEALKEAVFNGVNNLRYMDKILYEWGKKGYKTKEDVVKSREKWKEKNSSPKGSSKKEVFDYNWLEDDEDES